MSVEDFYQAIKSGNQAGVEEHIQADPAWLLAKQGGLSPVLMAVYYGHPQIASYLIEQGAPIDLFEAAASGQAARASALLDVWPEGVNAYAGDGFTPLGLAAFFGHLEIVEDLLRRGAAVNQPARNDLGAAPLHSAAAGGRLEICKRLVAAGADVNAREQDGFTPLQIAAENEQIELVRLFLENGADPLASAADGRTALDFARGKGNAELIEVLSGGRA